MPRGTRAIHGAEVQAGPHGHSGVTDSIILVDEEIELDVTCWCESWVMRIARSDLLEGRTAMCASPRCRPPEGMQTCEGDKVEIIGRPGVRRRSRVMHARLHRPAEQRKRPHLSRVEIERRRDEVANLWYQHLPKRVIAARLEISLVDVSNDLQWLRRRGILS